MVTSHSFFSVKGSTFDKSVKVRRYVYNVLHKDLQTHSVVVTGLYSIKHGRSLAYILWKSIVLVGCSVLGALMTITQYDVYVDPSPADQVTRKQNNDVTLMNLINIWQTIILEYF